MDHLRNVTSRIRSQLLRPDCAAFLGLLGLLFIFYPQLFLAKAAPLTGDHLEQHYPWAYLLAQSVKQFKLPFWTPLIHCGFPLVAESQVGAFYIPNLLMYFSLPFRIAYSYMNLVHWLIAGWGTYLYAKQMKLGAMAAFVAAIIFTFGSAYGGAYYNMTSLKTIAWFPVALCLFERYLEQSRSRYLLGLALVIGQSMVAGYLQMAAFTWLIFAAYGVLRVSLFLESPLPWKKRIRLIAGMAVSGIGALILAFPQLYLTFRLALASNRTGLEEGYAYVGSMSPLMLGTLLSPRWSLIANGNNLYAGYFTLFLSLFAGVSPEVRKTTFFRIWLVIALLALLLALGQWSPLYVSIVKITGFYSFRVPAKFLGFVCFGIAMLAAAGFQFLWQEKPAQRLLKRTFRILISLLLAYAAALAFFNVFLTSGKNVALRLGEAYVKRFLVGQPGHPHSLEYYLKMVAVYPEHILRHISLNDPVNIGISITAVLCACLAWAFFQKKMAMRSLLAAGIFFLVADLYAASYLDIRRDLAAYGAISASSPCLQVLEREKAAGRVGRIYGFRGPAQSLPLVPSLNALYGIADVGAYSPLVISRYYQTVGLLGNVNDSNLAVSPTPAFLYLHNSWLGFLNVSHILSAEPLRHPKFKLLEHDPAAHDYLYRSEVKRGGAYFFQIKNLRICENWGEIRSGFLGNDFDPSRTLLLEKSELKKCGFKKSGAGTPDGRDGVRMTLMAKQADRESWAVEVHGQGFFTVPDTMFTGWRARVNGEGVPVLKAHGMFRAVYLPGAGTYRVEFEYCPLAQENPS